jgi:hypothetical protein
MGYYVRSWENNFRLKKEKFDEAYTRMCLLNTTHHEEKRGGSWSEGEQKKKWFSWIDENYPETCTDVLEIIKALGFEIVLDTNTGDIAALQYDSKMGQEELFFQSIGDLVEKDSFIVWDGEDGEKWRWFFDGQKMVIQTGKVVYA